jgi:hypothetical protein
VRTSTDVLGGLSLIIRVVVAIDALQSLHAHREETRSLPEVRTSLHEPSRSRVPQGVRRDTLEASTLACGRKAFLDVLDALAVDVQDIA